MGLRGILNYLVSPGVPTARPTNHWSMPNFRWVGRGGDIQVGHFHLLDPLVYVFDSRRGSCEEPAAIDLALPISSVTVPPLGRELSYWPNYRGLQPHQRRLYLQWLNSNRTYLPPELGYTFIFFYNLERRALLERADIAPIAAEVTRLRQMYATSSQPVSGSWEGYSSRFIWLLLLGHKEALGLQDVKAAIQRTSHWTEDTLAIALACLWVRECRLTASTAYRLAELLPESQRSVVQHRVPKEFEELFKKRFREQHPEGIVIEPGASKRVFIYRPASNALPPCEASFNDPLRVRRQFKTIVQIWNACIQDLKRLGTIAKGGVDATSVSRWEAMPEDLRSGTDHPLTDAFCKLVETHSDDHGHIFLPAENVAAALDHESSAKLTLARCRKLCQTAEEIGYFLEPDARLTGRTYRPDEQLVAFLRMSKAPVDPKRYVPAACMLQLGFLTSASDGKADHSELGIIAHHIQSAFDLQEDEVRRLEMLQLLLHRTGPDRPLLRRLTRGLTKPQRQTIGRLLVAIVLADGVVTREEQKALKSACAILAIDFAEIEALLPKSVSSDEPVTVVPATEGSPGERLPARADSSFALDRNAIATILAETRDVAQMLANAMATTDESPTDESRISVATNVAPASPDAVLGVAVPVSSRTPPTKYAAFYVALIERDSWSKAEADAIARSQGLMLAGAMDAINEWAMDTLGGQLLFEESDNLVVTRSLLAWKKGIPIWLCALLNATAQLF